MNLQRIIRKREFIVGAIAASAVFTGLAHGLSINPVSPPSSHNCQFCHPDLSTLCDTRDCQSGTVCSGDYGQWPSGKRWVIAECIQDPRQL